MHRTAGKRFWLNDQTKPDQRRAAEICVEGWRRDPVTFVEHVLGEHLWSRQAEILRSVFSHRRTAVKAAHGVGKTRAASRAVLAWFFAFPNSKVLTTAPTWTQVEKLLWAEVANGVGKLPPFMRQGVTLLGTELRASRDWFALGLSTDQSERFQGYHAERMLIILDEAPGVRPEVWEAIEGIRATGNAHVLAIGNPTDPSGSFYDAFASDRDRWQTYTISAFDTPNLAGLTPETLRALPDDQLDWTALPYLTTRRWVREKLDEWGEGSPPWLARVLGEFPVEREDALVPLTWVERARERHVEVAADDPWQAGVDVAGPGTDETVLVVRHGARVVEMRAWANADPRGEIVAALSPYRERGIRVAVDVIGIGHYFEKHLEDNGFLVVPVNVGMVPSDKERFVNLKAELFWGLRERFERGEIAGIVDERMVAQVASIRFRYTARGAIQIESKDELMRRGIRSPDRAEALMLAFARSNRLPQGGLDLASEIVF